MIIPVKRKYWDNYRRSLVWDVECDSEARPRNRFLGGLGMCDRCFGVLRSAIAVWGFGDVRSLF
ncbi:MAG: hypothetical protein F6K62_05455 [Sphaerospermopsis sp. SIO1G2]|nr:hypothetical protein [Sphaerospermopsis sp. SIO1G2]